MIRGFFLILISFFALAPQMCERVPRKPKGKDIYCQLYCLEINGRPKWMWVCKKTKVSSVKTPQT